MLYFWKSLWEVFCPAISTPFFQSLIKVFDHLCMKLCFPRKVSDSTSVNCDPLLDTNSSGLRSAGKGGQESNYSSKCYLWCKCCFWPFIEAISQHDGIAEVNGAWTNRFLISVANLPHNESHKGTGCSGDAKALLLCQEIDDRGPKAALLFWQSLDMNCNPDGEIIPYICKFSRITNHWPTWNTAFWWGWVTEQLEQ